MTKAYLKYIFIIITALIFNFNTLCFAKDITNYICLNTAPVTLTPEEKEDNHEQKLTNTTAKTVSEQEATNKQKTNNPEKIKTISSQTPTKKAVITTPKTTAKRIKPLEVVDFDAKNNTLQTNDSESFLLVPVDKEQLEKETEQAKFEEISTSLIKDSPKPLSTKSKILSKIRKSNSQALNTHKSFKTKIKEILINAFILIFLSGIIFCCYLLYKKANETLSVKEKIKNLSYEEEKRNELIQAIEEFEQTEETHKKLGRKIYINELETYKNLDGFKKDEVADDIIKTMETIEKAQKNDTPLSIKETSSQGFKKANYVFENDLGTLSEEEGMALFNDDDDEKIYNTEDEFLNPDYYNENYDIINKSENYTNNDIFIIEDEDEETEEDNIYKIVEEEPKPEPQVEEKNENTEQQISEDTNNTPAEETIKTKEKAPEPKLEIKEKYPLDDNRGLALLKYKNTIALIGYIGENITVLKRFSKKDNAENLSVRIYEELSDKTAQYLVRTGNYKGIVEFTDSSVKLILNL